MPLSNAEKQKNYRKRLKDNPEKAEEIRKKNLQRIKTKTKKIKDMTEEEKEAKRKMWRKQKQQQKEKKQLQRNNEEKRVKETPVKKNSQKFLRQLKDRYKKSLSVIKKNNSTIATLRKRIYRLKASAERNAEEKSQEINKLKCRNEVLESVIKKIYKTSNTEKKRHMKKVTLNEAGRHGIHSKIFVAKCLGIARLRRTKELKQRKIDKISEEIKQFFIRDDITRITAGKKECRTKYKQREQIRYLTDTLSNLYKIYKTEGGTHSFSTFYRQKPFYVLSPTASSRDTCLCIKHSNANYLLAALIAKELIVHGTTLKDILKCVVCDVNSFDCIYNKCSDCVNSSLEFVVEDNRKNEEVKWWSWQSEKHTYTKKDKNSGECKEIQTRKTSKQLKTGTVLQLCETFDKEIKLFKKHYFNMVTQQNQYRKCLEQLKPDEVLLVCDYSENYNTKLTEEIQSMHFGASKNQISLHCVMIYWKDRCQSVCTVSDSLCHEPSAIWAHLFPIIKFIKKQNPSIKVLHIYSDGPTSQYRQKKNYFLLNFFAHKLNFDATWSFTESGHGKGVADGIGGAVKRCLDRQVLYGHDIKNADDVFNNIKAAMKSVKTFFIPVQEIENMKKIIPTNLQPLLGNNDVHQIITTKEENEIIYRPLSCFCWSFPEVCSCYLPKRHKLLRSPKIQCITVRERKRKLRETMLGEDMEAETSENEEMWAQEHSVFQHIPIVDIESTSLDAARRHEDVSKVIIGEDIASISPAIVMKESPCPGLTMKNEEFSDVIIGKDTSLKVTSQHSENEGINILLQEDVASDELPIVVIGPTSPGAAGRDEDLSDVIIGEDKSLDSTSHLSEIEDIQIWYQENIAPNDQEDIFEQRPIEITEPMTEYSSNAVTRQEDNRKEIMNRQNNVFRAKSLRNVVVRFFYCHKCHSRRFLTTNEANTCIICQSIACSNCRGQEGTSYICDKCLSA